MTEKIKMVAATVLLALSVTSLTYDILNPVTARADEPNGQCVYELFCCMQDCAVEFCGDYCFPTFMECFNICMVATGNPGYCQVWCEGWTWSECGYDCFDGVCASYDYCE